MINWLCPFLMFLGFVLFGIAIFIGLKNDSSRLSLKERVAILELKVQLLEKK